MLLFCGLRFSWVMHLLTVIIGHRQFVLMKSFTHFTVTLGRQQQWWSHVNCSGIVSQFSDVLNRPLVSLWISQLAFSVYEIKVKIPFWTRNTIFFLINFYVTEHCCEVFMASLHSRKDSFLIKWQLRLPGSWKLPYRSRGRLLLLAPFNTIILTNALTDFISNLLPVIQSGPRLKWSGFTLYTCR